MNITGLCQAGQEAVIVSSRSSQEKGSCIKIYLIDRTKAAIQSPIQVCRGVLHTIEGAGNVDWGSEISYELPLQEHTEMSQTWKNPTACRGNAGMQIACTVCNLNFKFQSALPKRLWKVADIFSIFNEPCFNACEPIMGEIVLSAG